jgi:hypothetical protein
MSSSIYEMSLILAQSQFKKQMKNSEKRWKRQLWTLGYILVLQTMSFSFSSIFWFGPIEFPSKIVPCS